jgi:hydrogenase maturation protein HypF
VRSTTLAQESIDSVERPIVLLTRREDSGVADAIAPGLPTVGLMLAYTPLHVLLLRESDARS